MKDVKQYVIWPCSFQREILVKFEEIFFLYKNKNWILFCVKKILVQREKESQLQV